MNDLSNILEQINEGKKIIESEKKNLKAVKKQTEAVSLMVQAKDSLKAFMMYDGRDSWQSDPALDMIIDKLEQIERGDIRRLMIFLQPRAGKSQLTSKKFPAWYFMRNPDKEVVIASYGADLAENFSRIARDTVLEHGEKLFGVQLDRENVGRWSLKKHRGGVSAVGVGGALTGFGSSLSILDDVVKDNEQAQSESYREKVYEWYKTVLRTRSTQDGAIVVVMTRWHEEDLAGKLLKDMQDGGEKWEVLSFPAYAKEDDILGRQVGEVLFPNRFPKEVLEETRIAIGRKAWASLYMQEPYIEDGELFKRQHFKYFDYRDTIILDDEIVKKHQIKIYQTIDTAMKTGKKNDHTAICTFGVTPKKNILIFDVRRGKWEVPDQLKVLTEEFKKWRPIFQGIEDKQSGVGLLQELRRMGRPIKVLKTGRSNKGARAETIAVYYEQGKVYHSRSISDLEGFEQELLRFDPNSDNSEDDRVDVISYMGQIVQNGGTGKRVEKPKGW